MSIFSQKEHVLGAVVFAAIAIWIYFLVPIVISIGSLPGYAIFLLVYVYLVFKLLEIPFNTRQYFAFLLVFLALDVIAPPMMISQTGFSESLIPEQKLSSDVFIYQLLPSGLPHEIRYFLVYVGISVILLVIARTLTTKKGFVSLVHHNV